MAVCRNCSARYEGSRDLCSSCLAKTPACLVCGRPIDEHSLTYSKEKYPKPLCPSRGEDVGNTA